MSTMSSFCLKRAKSLQTGSTCNFGARETISKLGNSNNLNQAIANLIMGKCTCQLRCSVQPSSNKDPFFYFSDQSQKKEFESHQRKLSCIDHIMFHQGKYFRLNALFPGASAGPGFKLWPGTLCCVLV